MMENQLLVIFGASGDLTMRKLIPALFGLFRQQLLPKHFAILGVARTTMSSEQFRDKISKELEDKLSGENPVSGDIISFTNLLHYLSIDTSDPNEYFRIREMITELDSMADTDGNCLFYMATPPGLYETIATGLKLNNLTIPQPGWKRVIVEKPFGYNLRSAVQLNKYLLDCFTEDQIYRIDHYLGKETVQNVMVTRFSNGIFEPLWNRNYVHHVEITSAESIGVEGRGGYYEKSGALRDMVQNHLLNLVSMIAMEPPTIIHAQAIRNETLKVLQSIRIPESDEVIRNVVRGQYSESTVRGIRQKSYREETGVAPGFPHRNLCRPQIVY